MDAMERRCQIIEILCDAKMRIKMRDLASRFNVSIRTDVDVLSLTYPIQTTRGRYNGGIGFIDGYRQRMRASPRHSVTSSIGSCEKFPSLTRRSYRAFFTTLP